MTANRLPDDIATDAEEFEAALADLIENSIEQGVDVRGAWEFRTDGSTHDWEVEIFELASYPDGDGDGADE